MAASTRLMEKANSYLPEDRFQLVNRALKFASRLHAGQNRRSGRPFIGHPISIAEFLADLKLDATTLSAALLHDVVEDCGVTLGEIEEKFGADVAILVDGVTKLTQLDIKSGDSLNYLQVPSDGVRAESIRKMLVAMAKDIRVVLIKLGDRLHNMQTLSAMPPERRVSIAQETLDIYAPLAGRLGIWSIKWKLEDLAFRNLQPNRYRAISRLLSSKRHVREEYIGRVTSMLGEELSEFGLQAEVTGRPKHIYSIHKKIQSYRAQGKEVSDIHDLFAVRVLVPRIQDCYAALGVVHSLWHPLPGQFDDYIASPRQNMYQSLHTTVRCIGGVPIEVQLRTHQMHQLAEYGVASHWRYKEVSVGKDAEFDQKIAWVRQLLEWQREIGGAEEFLESVKTDIFRDQVFVYTPKGDIKELPTGATPIDFAYSIHTEIGHRCIGAKVNTKLVALDFQLQSGDTVEIVISKKARGPSLDWLNPHLGYTKTSHARQNIRTWFRRQERETNIQRGRDLLKKELPRLNAGVDEREIANLFKIEVVEDLLAALGNGSVTTAQVVSRITLQQSMVSSKNEPPLALLKQPNQRVTVRGVGDLLTRMALCCNPLPGDAILGYITRGRGVTVHRKSCSNLRAGVERGRFLPVSWGDSRSLYPVRLSIDAWDRVGLLSELSTTVSAEGVNIASVVTEERDDDTVVTHMTMHVAGIEQLSRLFSRLEDVRGVTGVFRVTSAQDSSPKEKQQRRKHSGAAKDAIKKTFDNRR